MNVPGIIINKYPVRMDRQDIQIDRDEVIIISAPAIGKMVRYMLIGMETRTRAKQLISLRTWVGFE